MTGSHPHVGGRATRDMLLLALVAITLYVPLIGWGVPYATGPDRVFPFSTDDILPLGPLAEMRNSFIQTRPDRNYGYPWWHYFVAAAAQSPYVLYLWASGGIQRPDAAFPFGLKDPVSALRWLTLIGRILTLAMAIGVVVAAYWFGRVLWDRTTGLITAALTSLNYLMVYYARTGNVDVPAFFWTAVGAVWFAVILKHGLTPGRAAWLGLFAGLAMATKDQALVVFLPFGCALLAPRLNRRPGDPYPVRALSIGFSASVVAYVVGAGMLVDPQRHIVHVSGLLFHPEWVTAASGPNVARHARTFDGFLSLSAEYMVKLADTVSRPVLVAATVGAILAVRRAPRYLVFLPPVVLLFVILAVPTGLVVRRYFLPLTLFVDAFAAFLVVAFWRSPRLKALGTAVLVGLCGWRLTVAADLSYAQYRDTRYPASAWLGTHARADDRVEYFGSRQILPHLDSAIKTRRIPEEIQRHGERSDADSILRYLNEQRPDYVLVIPDWTSKPGMDRSADCPEGVYRALLEGTAGYRQATYFPPQSLLPDDWRPALDYPTVSPPVRIFTRTQAAQSRVSVKEP